VGCFEFHLFLKIHPFEMRLGDLEDSIKVSSLTNNPNKPLANNPDLQSLANNPNNPDSQSPVYIPNIPITLGVLA
jgi:hypothetical protein